MKSLLQSVECESKVEEIADLHSLEIENMRRQKKKG